MNAVYVALGNSKTPLWFLMISSGVISMVMTLLFEMIPDRIIRLFLEEGEVEI